MVLPYEKDPRECIFSDPFSGIPRPGSVRRCYGNHGMHRLLTVAQAPGASPTVKMGAIACCLGDGASGDELCVSWVWHTNARPEERKQSSLDLSDGY